jgi:hypothetical protein
MSLIDKTYFLLPPNEIPMTDASNGYSAELTASETLRINNTITRYEDKFFRKLMSKALYAEYLASLTTPVEKWTTFVSKLRDESVKRSPIANYTFCGWLVENQSKLNNRATATKEKSQNSTVVDLYPLYKASWDDMVRQMEVFSDWLVEDDLYLDYEDSENDKYFLIEGFEELLKEETYGF